MIKKRNNREVRIKEPPKNNIEDTEINLNPSKQATDWKQQACEVLNLMEKNGINIYDENRKPGMYLKTKDNSKIPSIFKKKKINNDETLDIKENNFTNEQLSKIFKNGK